MQMDMVAIKYKKDEMVFNEDSLRDKIYMVKSGEFKLMKQIIFQNKSKESQTPLSMKIRQSLEICKLEVGDIFGEEVAMVNNKPKRLYRAICSSQRSEVYEFDYSQFKEFLAANQSESLYAKCVELIYKQRQLLTDQKISQKSFSMQKTRSQMLKSKSCDPSEQRAAYRAVDEEGYDIPTQPQITHQNEINSSRYMLQSNSDLAAQFSNLKCSTNSQGEKYKVGVSQVNQGEQQKQPLLKIKSSQQFCAELILQSQNKQSNINNSNNQINFLYPPPSSISVSSWSKISQSQSQTQLKQMTNQSSFQKLSTRIQNSSEISNSTVSTLQCSQDQSANSRNSHLQNSQNPQAIHSHPIYPQTGASNEQINQPSHQDMQHIEIPMNAKSIQAKHKMLKIKQLKQQQSSISQNINFFKEQQSQPVNCITIFEKLDSFNKPQQLSTHQNFNALQEVQFQKNHLQITDAEKITSRQNSPSPTARQSNNNNNPSNNIISSQVQFFNIINNQNSFSQRYHSSSNYLNTIQAKDSNQQLCDQVQENSEQNKVSLSELDQEDDVHKYVLRSKLQTRKRAITLSPTKKQIKTNVFSSNKNLNNFSLMYNKQHDYGQSDDENLMRETIKEEEIDASTANPNNISLDPKNGSKDNNQIQIQTDISTKNTSRQSTATHNCKGQMPNELAQSQQSKPNIFYFNSHYLSDKGSRSNRLQITKNTSISTLQRMISQSQNIQKSVDQTQNKSKQEPSIEISKSIYPNNKSFSQLESKKVLQVDRYRIKIRESGRPSSALDRIKAQINQTNQVNQNSGIQLNDTTSPQKSINPNTSSGSLTLKLRKAGQNYLNTVFTNYKDSLNSTGYIHFPQNDIKKIKLPSRKITEILQIKRLEE